MSRMATMIRLRRATPFASTPICSRERRRNPVFAWSAVAMRLWVRKVLPMNSSAMLIASIRMARSIEIQIAWSTTKDASAT